MMVPPMAREAARDQVDERILEVDGAVRRSKKKRRREINSWKRRRTKSKER